MLIDHKPHIPNIPISKEFKNLIWKIEQLEKHYNDICELHTKLTIENQKLQDKIIDLELELEEVKGLEPKCVNCGERNPQTKDGPFGYCDECIEYARAGANAYSKMDKMKKKGTW